MIRNRIKDHRRVLARDLVPHELNPRTHSDAQKEALQALYQEVGFARSLLAYELPDGRLKLIDGHLRKSMDPDQEVEVEVLDVSDDEARKLLLSIDPLAQLAGYDEETLDQLRDQVATDSDTLRALWSALEATDRQELDDLEKETKKKQKGQKEEAPDRYHILIRFTRESEQVKCFRKLKKEGYQCELKTV